MEVAEAAKAAPQAQRIQAKLRREVRAVAYFEFTKSLV
jgi:hypothetical protein